MYESGAFSFKFDDLSGEGGKRSALERVARLVSQWCNCSRAFSSSVSISDTVLGISSIVVEGPEGRLLLAISAGLLTEN